MKHFIFTLCAIFMCAVSMVGCSDDENNETKPVFTVTFDSQGGSEVASQKVTQGEKATKPSNPSKEGLAFKGWYTSTEYVKEWNFETDAVTADITLYARWTAETWTVTFNTNGGSEVESVLVAKGGLIGDLPVPTKEGYIFEGWYVDESLSKKFDKSIPVTQNLTLHAKWVEESSITREMLEEAVREASEYDDDNYTEVSFGYLRNKINEAQNVLNKQDATAKEIATAYAGLKEAIAQLVPLVKRETVSIYINPEPIDGVIYLNVDKRYDYEGDGILDGIPELYIEANGEDISGGNSTNDKVTFSYDEAELKSWAKGGEIFVNDGRLYGGSLRFTPKFDLQAGKSVDITIISADDTSVKEKITLKTTTQKDMKKLFIDAVNALSAAQNISFENYFQINDAYQKCWNAYNYLSWNPGEEDQEIRNAEEKLDNFESTFDSWWHMGYFQIAEGKYMLDGDESTFTSDGNFPCGTFVVIYDISGNGDRYGKEIVTFKSDNTFVMEYGEGSDIAQIVCEREGEGEYKLHQGDSKQGIIIVHLTKEYDTYSFAKTKQSLRGQKMMKRNRK